RQNGMKWRREVKCHMRAVDFFWGVPFAPVVKSSTWCPSVRIPHQILKCVAFIGEVSHLDDKGNVFGDLHATGFFVSVRSSEFPELRHAYFVTAKHVAEDIKDNPPYILVNGLDGRPTHITNFGPQWFYHPTDANADVAILEIAEQSNVDNLAVLTDDFVT